MSSINFNPSDLGLYKPAERLKEQETPALDHKTPMASQTALEGVIEWVKKDAACFGNHQGDH